MDFSRSGSPVANLDTLASDEARQTRAALRRILDYLDTLASDEARRYHNERDV